MAHGTTTGTNALLERTGALTGLLTTDGFRDVLEIMRTDRESGYDLTWHKPRPLVRRRFRREVRERVDKDGHVDLPLDESQATAAIGELFEFGVESIAEFRLIHAYANPSHERFRDRRCEEPVCSRDSVHLSAAPRSCAASPSSSKEPAASTEASSPVGATSWTEAGSPSSAGPQGSASAGQPSALKG